jgi:hypothetical protein
MSLRSVVLSSIGVTYRRGLDLNYRIYLYLYIHTTRDYKQLQHYRYSTFSVFTSRILATDLSQSHCHFKSHVESSCHSLIPFLALVLRLPTPKTRLNSIPLLPSSYPGRLASRNSTRLNYWSVLLRTVFCVLL